MYSVNLANLRNPMRLTEPVSAEEYREALRKLLSNAGVDLALPESVLLNDRQGLLVVRATDNDLKTINVVVTRLNNSRAATHAPIGQKTGEDALELLRLRYARGEIDRETFLQTNADLGGPAPPG